MMIASVIQASEIFVYLSEFYAPQAMDYIEFVKEYRDRACRYADAAIRLQEPGNQAMTGGS